MNLQPNIMVFSVYQKDALYNDIEHNLVIERLAVAKVPYKVLLGLYKGVTEQSILVQGFEHRGTVEALCAEYNQQCYLESHNDRMSFLVFPNGTKQKVGILKTLSASDALKQECYSFCPELNQYYVTIME